MITLVYLTFLRFIPTMVIAVISCPLHTLNIFLNDFMILHRYADQGPVVQSIVSLTSSLRGQLVKRFTT